MEGAIYGPATEGRLRQALPAFLIGSVGWGAMKSVVIATVVMAFLSWFYTCPTKLRLTGWSSSHGEEGPMESTWPIRSLECPN
ncbi:hypothetical protein QJS10_CPB11g00734 [Acorus calamus]|uniref:Uncharacterized protein n=1 Tax=Acorus calamus TaxID=4465 RepID=A0AAV9DW94_ACOCL|nr:hypothetical protein QJS10_CPB11g00734 [Acorus calamus]